MTNIFETSATLLYNESHEKTQKCEICEENIKRSMYQDHLEKVHFCSFAGYRKSIFVNTEPVKCLKCRYMVHFRDRLTNINCFKRHFAAHHFIENSQVSSVLNYNQILLQNTGLLKNFMNSFITNVVEYRTIGVPLS